MRTSLVCGRILAYRKYIGEKCDFREKFKMATVRKFLKTVVAYQNGIRHSLVGSLLSLRAFYLVTKRQHSFKRCVALYTIIAMDVMSVRLTSVCHTLVFYQKINTNITITSPTHSAKSLVLLFLQNQVHP